MPNGFVVPILRQVRYRLSRVYSGGVDLQSYHRIICFNEEYTTGMSPYFVEGFDAFEFIVESARTFWNFRKQTSTPQMLFNVDRLRVVGSEQKQPTLCSRLSITPAPAGFQINDKEEEAVFSCSLRDIDASHGEEIDAYNSTEAGTNTDLNLYDRDVRSVNRQRNILGSRAMFSPTPAPEGITEQLLEVF